MLAPDHRAERDAQKDAFLSQAGWVGAVRVHLAGDASFRSYERVQGDGCMAVLMDAADDVRESDPAWPGYTPGSHLAANLGTFIRMTRYLRDAGLNAPEILAVDEAAGLLLLRDLGDDSFSRVLNYSPHQEAALYTEAANVLVRLQDAKFQPPDWMPAYDATVMKAEASLLADWFLPQAVGLARAMELKAEFMQLWDTVLAATSLRTDCVVMRDFHADNLMWCEGELGLARVGLLDYQDALAGDTAYDMVSYLEDARRDVSDATREAVIAHYLAQSGENEQDFLRRFALYGAQRNCKIVGIFTRLCLRDRKPHYLEFLPRVWRVLERDLAHQSLAPLREWMDKHVPLAMRGVFIPDASHGSLT